MWEGDEGCLAITLIFSRFWEDKMCAFKKKERKGYECHNVTFVYLVTNPFVVFFVLLNI